MNYVFEFRVSGFGFRVSGFALQVFNFPLVCCLQFSVFCLPLEV